MKETKVNVRSASKLSKSFPPFPSYGDDMSCTWWYTSEELNPMRLKRSQERKTVPNAGVEKTVEPQGRPIEDGDESARAMHSADYKPGEYFFSMLT